MDDVWNLETSEEKQAIEELNLVMEFAMNGDIKFQNILRKVWDNESWKSIKEKLETEGSVWYVWTMDGVRNWINLRKMTEEEALQKLDEMEDKEFMEFLDSLPPRVVLMVKGRMVNWREVLPAWYVKRSNNENTKELS